jgi:N-acylethanolamine-hydrolysing acid amidase
MSSILFKVLIASTVMFSQASSQYIGQNANGLKIYKINLDRKPQERFKEVTIDLKEDTIKALRFYTGFVPAPIMWSIEQALQFIWIPKLNDYYDEVVGISKYLGIDKRLVLLIQFVYDFSSFCTSIVAAEAGTGNVIHARNLDFLNPEIMRNITYEAHFYKNEKLLYRATMFSGLNGVMTGERPNGFSISLNSRNPSYRTDFIVLAINLVSYLSSSYK